MAIAFPGFGDCSGPMIATPVVDEPKTIPVFDGDVHMVASITIKRVVDNDLLATTPYFVIGDVRLDPLLDLRR